MIGFVGLSHLGLVSSIAAAAKGFEVVAFDPDAALVNGLRQGRLPVLEPGLAELLEKNRGRLRFSSDPTLLNTCAVTYVSTDVPTGADNRADLSVVEALVERALLGLATDGTLVVLSQVRPGFTRNLARHLRASRPGLGVFCQVETLIFGRAVERALSPERYIVGCADPLAPLPAAYAELLAAGGCPVLPMRYESAELAKIAINLFLVSSVSVTNTLAELCEAIGADWAEIVPALRLDRRIGLDAYLSPGLGLAGGNLERDLTTVDGLAREYGTEAGIIGAWMTGSRHHRDWVLKTLHAEVIAVVEAPVVAVWGLAYKADTKSTKNSPALAMLEALEPFDVRVWDPAVTLDRTAGRIVQSSSALEACRGADALAIMTPWADFREVEVDEVRRLMRGPVIVDPYGVLDPARCTRVGLRHFRLGTPGAVAESVA